jgi:hypothetical protein
MVAPWNGEQLHSDLLCIFIVDTFVYLHVTFDYMLFFALQIEMGASKENGVFGNGAKYGQATISF